MTEMMILNCAADLPGLDERRCGLKGSPTQVERIFPPEKKTDKEVFTGEPEALEEKLYGLLKAGKFV